MAIRRRGTRTRVKKPIILLKRPTYKKGSLACFKSSHLTADESKERKKERITRQDKQAKQVKHQNFIGRGRYKVLQVLSFCKFVVPGKFNM